jgi:hypothetical protein
MSTYNNKNRIFASGLRKLRKLKEEYAIITFKEYLRADLSELSTNTLSDIIRLLCLDNELVCCYDSRHGQNCYTLTFFRKSFLSLLTNSKLTVTPDQRKVLRKYNKNLWQTT